MKRIWLMTSLAALSAACAVTACSSKDDDKGTDPSSGGEGNSSSGGSENSGAGQPSSDGGMDSAQGGGDSGQGGNAAGEGGMGTGTITSCSTGTVFAGNPVFDGDTEDIGASVDGQGLLDDPPLRHEALAFIGNSVFIETEKEIWTSDLSAATPTLTRIAGVETEAGGAFLEAGKPCADTRFLVIRDMVAKANGKLAVVDYIGNAVVEISDPSGPDCKSEYVAGTHVKSVDPASEYPVLPGDKDGPGAEALFGNADNHGSLFRITADPDNNLYVWDNGNEKFKMIANEDDAERTVTTVGVAPAGDNIMGLTFLAGKLYATGVDGSNDVLLEIDPATYDAEDPGANVKEIFRERDHFPDDIESSRQAVLSQLTNDGEALILASQSGFVWRVGTDGTVLATLAGTGPRLDYSTDFDPTTAHPANEWQLLYPTNSNGGPWLAVNDSKLYWAGGVGVGKHVVELDCK
jgi:hypothetical protein